MKYCLVFEIHIEEKPMSSKSMKQGNQKSYKSSSFITFLLVAVLYSTHMMLTIIIKYFIIINVSRFK